MELSDYIKIIKEFNTKQSDKLIELMDSCGVNSLSEVTVKMAEDYVDSHPDMRKRRITYEQMVNGGNTCL